MILFLITVGLLRALLDVPWIYWQAGGLPLLVPSLADPVWYAVNVGPYVLSVLITALLRWVRFAAIAFRLLPADAALRSWLMKLNFGFVPVCLAAFAVLFGGAGGARSLPLRDPADGRGLAPPDAPGDRKGGPNGESSTKPRFQPVVLKNTMTMVMVETMASNVPAPSRVRPKANPSLNKDIESRRTMRKPW